MTGYILNSGFTGERVLPVWRRLTKQMQGLPPLSQGLEVLGGLPGKTLFIWFTEI